MITVPYSKASLSTLSARLGTLDRERPFHVHSHHPLSDNMTGVSTDPKGMVKPLVQHYEALKVSPGHSYVRALDELGLHLVGPQPESKSNP